MSGNDVKITEWEDGTAEFVSRWQRLDFQPDEWAALREHFAAERMPEDVQKLIDQIQRRTDALAREGIQGGSETLLLRAATALEAAYSQNAEQVWEYQCRLTGNAWTDVSAWHRCQGERRRRVAAGPWQSVEEGTVDEPR